MVDLTLAFWHCFIRQKLGRHFLGNVGTFSALFCYILALIINVLPVWVWKVLKCLLATLHWFASLFCLIWINNYIESNLKPESDFLYLYTYLTNKTELDFEIYKKATMPDSMSILSKYLICIVTVLSRLYIKV